MKHELSIIGAGPAGATAALFLAKQGIPSLLIDKHTFPRDKICGDACSGKVAWVLNRLQSDLAHSFIDHKANLPSWGIRFFGTENNELRVPFKLDYSSAEDVAPGFISKRKDFDAQLIELVRKEPKITFLENFSITSTYRKEGHIVFTNKLDQKEYTTKVVLAADGAYSNTVKSLLPQEIKDDRNALGLRAYYSGVKDLDPEGFIELHFLKDILPGYFWIFPLPNGQANVGLGMRSDLLKDKRWNLKEVFEKVISSNPHIAKRFENATLVDKVRLHGLPLGGLKNISSDNLLVLGDAAALIDPFTGEGIGNAMISGMLAAEVLAKNYANKTYSATYLKEYDNLVYKRLGSELQLSQNMQSLTQYPWLFNFVVNKARKNVELQETITCMFDNVDIRKKLRNPLFYLRILFG